MTNERDHSKFIIQRFDTYITGANTKGNFLLAMNTFLIGVIISNYSKIELLINCNHAIIYFDIGIILLTLLSLLAMLFILKSVYPFILSGNSSSDGYHSHIFFNSVAEFKGSQEFRKSFLKQEDLNIEEDMSSQAFYLAKGLKTKYKNLETAMKFIYVELVIIVVLLMFVIIF
ncbi:Pycsar system effector family protein [Flavobacterium sp. CF136]|uniref:Pycsar system effector family protein n=1 Tax=Flavobacterium sp. (strain CF136) TaxID=1144313 RepID=UPI0002718E81|nr:Pycsar system effector family protein [Flavobacterium sp. CF136]EJL60418.1 hypothetical protein PMI10_03843 [Flavobacterium sp. CF136]